MRPIALSALALALLLPLSACGEAPHTATTQNAKDATESASHSITGEVQRAMEEAKQELALKNIDVDSIHVGADRDHDGHSRPSAQISPQGELLIAGKKVPASPEQMALLLDYRSHVLDIAYAGMDIGTEGASLGLHAAREAIWGALAGKSEQDIEASIKPQVDKIEAAALKLCQRLPDLLASQQKLAAAMPEFRPYASMELQDIDDCAKQIVDKNGKNGFAIFSD